MSSAVEEFHPQPAAPPNDGLLPVDARATPPSLRKARPQTFLALPVAAAISLSIHFFVQKKEIVLTSNYYPIFLFALLGFGILLALLHPFLSKLRKWMRRMCPIFAVATLTLGIWELVTTCLGLLPLPYFPGPEGVLGSMVSDYQLLFDSTWHSLILLVGGYALGTIIALITGVTIGWFPHARYWGMPLLKVIGPIPATAWIPLAMVVSPSALWSAIGLIALAVWFPVTMLTASGISNTRASYLDVARTLGAGPPI